MMLTADSDAIRMPPDGFKYPEASECMQWVKKTSRAGVTRISGMRIPSFIDANGDRHSARYRARRTCLCESEREMTSDFQEDLVALLPRLRRFGFTLTANLDQADDLVQQACEKALRNQAQWQVGTRLDSWMFRIMQNLHIDHLRSQGRRSEHLHEDSVAELVDNSGAAQPERENMLGVLSDLIAELPEEQRSVMLLVAVEELTYKEAAEALEIPVGTVMSRLARARARITALLDDPAKSFKAGIAGGKNHA